MADYNINAITRRVVFDGSSGLGPYAFTFEVLDQNDVAVYFNTTLLTITTDYTVTVNANGTGSVTIVTGSSVPSTPIAEDSITIIGARDIERVTDFVTAGDLLASSLNEQLDALTIFDQQLSEENARSLRAPVYDPELVADGGTLDMTLPKKADRAGKLLQFNSTTGNPEVVTEIGSFKGDWAASTQYYVRDIIKDTSNSNIYICNTAHTSSGSEPLTTNTDSAKWDLLVDAASVATSAANAATSESNAADSETNAAASESNAATSETNASTSATTASAAKDAATAARDAVFTSLDSFDDRYLGAMADTQAQATAVTDSTFTTGTTSMTVVSASGIVVGMEVASTGVVIGGSGIPSDTNVISIDGTTITVNNELTATRTSMSVTFTGRGVLGNFDATKDGPSTDNDGNALVGGQLYYNSTDNQIRLYNGTSWVATYVSGGDFLPLAGGTMTGNIHYGDNVKATFGDSGTPDLELYHDGGDSVLEDQGTGDLYIGGSRIRLRQTSSVNMFLVADTSGVKLYDGAGYVGFSTSPTQLNCSKLIRGVNAKEVYASVTSTSNTTTCDTTTSAYFYTTLTENTTFAFSNPDNEHTTTIVLEIKQDASASGFTVGWPAAVKWAGGTAPTLSAGANDVDLLTFITRDQGTTWYGFVSGLDMS